MRFVRLMQVIDWCTDLHRLHSAGCDLDVVKGEVVVVVVVVAAAVVHM
jgi:hypothetical protein